MSVSIAGATTAGAAWFMTTAAVAPPRPVPKSKLPPTIAAVFQSGLTPVEAPGAVSDATGAAGGVFGWGFGAFVCVDPGASTGVICADGGLAWAVFRTLPLSSFVA